MAILGIAVVFGNIGGEVSILSRVPVGTRVYVPVRES